ncbi:MAG: XRE family transcriptional regulator [Bradyrhizobium sp.]|nr:MAG: XRE family transcriptional regulator [Bradyrhizobium sp.]
MPTHAARRALGAFLRAHREQLEPPAGAAGRRRTPGLRREEIAEASGASLTWIAWLEQGREVSPSPRLLARLADALRLAPAERAYLFELADKRDPHAVAIGKDALAAEILALPAAMTIPAYLLDGQWTARAWNDRAAELFDGWLDGAHDRNLLRFIFRSPGAPKLIVDWEDRARRVVAEFRADFSRRLRDPALGALVEELTEASPVFARLWREQAVLGREGGERRFRQPARRFHQTTLIVASHPEAKLVCLAPIET